MKKTSKILSAVALSAALALGTAVPAFATSVDSSSASATGTNTLKVTPDANGNETTVSVVAKAPALSATVPLNVTVVAAAQGGPLVAKPDNYAVVNKSELPLRITNITAKAVDGGAWSYVPATLTMNEGTPSGKTAEQQLTGADTPTGSIGDISIALNGVNITGTSTTDTFKTKVNYTDAKFTAGADTSTEKNGVSLTLPISGSTTAIKSNLDANGEMATASQAVKLTYTVQLISAVQQAS